MIAPIEQTFNWRSTDVRTDVQQPLNDPHSQVHPQVQSDLRTSQGFTYSPDDLRTSTENKPPLKTAAAYSPVEISDDGSRLHPPADQPPAALRDRQDSHRRGPDDRRLRVEGTDQDPHRQT